MCCDSGGGDAPTTDPRQLAVMERQQELAERMADYTVQSEGLNRERLSKLDVQNEAIAQDFLKNSRTASARSDDQWNYYQEKGRPMMNRMFDDANTFDSESALAGLRAKASADVEQAFGGQRESASRMMGRMGVNPNTGRAMSALAAGGAGAALAKVNAANTATEGRRLAGVGLRQQAANAAQGFPASSINFSSLGNSSNSGATGTGQLGMNNALGIQGAMTGGLNSAAGQMGNIAGNYTGILNAQTSAWNAQQQADASSSAGLGSALGTLGAAGIKAGWFSDIRLKRDIERIGETPELKLPLYTFKYLWDDEVHTGVMAHEAEQVIPEAVMVNPSGFKMVNYALVR